MRLYHRTANTLTLDGIRYAVDDQGFIDVPDDKMNCSVWNQGFVKAGPIEAALAAEAALLAEAAPVAVTAEPAPAEPTPAKPAAKDTTTV